MKQLWLDSKTCMLDGLRFEFVNSGYVGLRTSAERVWVLKPREFFDRYDAYFGDAHPRNILELGIFEGGSSILFADRWPGAKIVGIDNRAPNLELRRHIERLGLSNRISHYFRTSQDDRGAVSRIIEREFPAGLDLVIDDASHMYGLTKASFDIAFPYLEPNGQYIVEDWAWAHWPDWQDREQWRDRPALSNFLFEVSMSCASSSSLISDVYINTDFFSVRKAPTCPKLDGDFRFDRTYLLRGKSLNQI